MTNLTKLYKIQELITCPTNLPTEEREELNEYIQTLIQIDKDGNKQFNIFGYKQLFEAINYTHSCTKLKCEKCESDWVEIRATCFNCQHETGDLST